MRLNGALDAATKRNWLNWTDAEGRTALHHACLRNYLQVAQIVSHPKSDVMRAAHTEGSLLCRSMSACRISISSAAITCDCVSAAFQQQQAEECRQLRLCNLFSASSRGHLST
jgi:hypothetical protein